MRDILAALDVIGSGKRGYDSRLYFIAKIGLIAPFGEIESAVLEGNLSMTGLAIRSQKVASLLSHELVDSIWTVKLDLVVDGVESHFSLAAQLVRMNVTDWIGFQFVCLSDEDSAFLEQLIANHASRSSVEAPVSFV